MNGEWFPYLKCGVMRLSLKGKTKSKNLAKLGAGFCYDQVTSMAVKQFPNYSNFCYNANSEEPQRW